MVKKLLKPNKIKFADAKIQLNAKKYTSTNTVALKNRAVPLSFREVTLNKTNSIVKSALAKKRELSKIG